MPASYSVWERRDHVDRNDLALAALQLCRRNRAHPGISSSKYYWMNASKILFLTEGEPGSLNLEEFNKDADNVAAGFAVDDLARFIEGGNMADAAGGQASYQLAGSPTGSD